MAITQTKDPYAGVYSAAGQIAGAGLGQYLGPYTTPLVAGAAQGVGTGWYGTPQFIGGAGGTLGYFLGQGSPYQNVYGKAGSVLGGGLGTYLTAMNQNPNLTPGQALLRTGTGQQFAGGLGSLIGAALGSQSNPYLWSGIGNVAGQVTGPMVGNLISSQPLTQGINWGNVGGAGLGTLGGYLGQKWGGPIGGMAGSTIGNVAGQYLPQVYNAISSALSPAVQTATGAVNLGSTAANVGTSITSALPSIGAGLASAIAAYYLNKSAQEDLKSRGLAAFEGDAYQRYMAKTGLSSGLSYGTLGATVGSAIPGIGTLIGGIIGGLYGVISSAFGGSSTKKKAERRAKRAVAAQFAKLQSVPTDVFYSQGVGGLNQALTDKIVNSFAGRGKILRRARARATTEYSPEAMWASAQAGMPSYLAQTGFGEGWKPTDPTLYNIEQWQQGIIGTDEAAMQEAAIRRNLQNYMGTRIFQELVSSGRISQAPTTAGDYSGAWKAWKSVPKEEAASWWTGPTNLTDEQFKEAYGMSPARWLFMSRHSPTAGFAAGATRVNDTGGAMMKKSMPFVQGLLG